MERDERKDDFLKKKNVTRPSNPPGELAQNVSKKKKNLSDELCLHFSSKVQNLTVFSIIYMIRIRFFGPGELIQRYFFRPHGTVMWETLPNNADGTVSRH